MLACTKQHGAPPPSPGRAYEDAVVGLIPLLIQHRSLQPGLHLVTISRGTKVTFRVTEAAIGCESCSRVRCFLFGLEGSGTVLK